jgi:hypothetical protein
LTNEFINLVIVDKIARHSGRIAIAPLDLAPNFFELNVAARRENDASTGAAKNNRDRLANASSGSGHERDFSLERLHRF